MVKLEQIMPRVKGESDRNSWNLYRFAKKYWINKLRFYSNIPYENLSKSYDIFVSTKEQKYSFLDHSKSGVRRGIKLYGKRLINIFCSGYGLTSIYARDKSEFQYDITEEFWNDYTFYGRCRFLGNMSHKYNEWYEAQQDNESTRRVRICEYCGKKQYLKSWSEFTTKAEWIDEK